MCEPTSEGICECPGPLRGTCLCGICQKCGKRTERDVKENR